MERNDKVFLFIGAVLIILAILFKAASIYSPNPIDKKYRNKYYKLFLTFGLALTIWFGARFQNLNIFGTHFTALFILLIGAISFVWVTVKMLKDYRGEKRFWEKEQVKLKYLPK